MNRPLTKRQLYAVTYAVETLTSFSLMETQGAIKALCELDPRVAENVPAHSREALKHLGLVPILKSDDK